MNGKHRNEILTGIFAYQPKKYILVRDDGSYFAGSYWSLCKEDARIFDMEVCAKMRAERFNAMQPVLFNVNVVEYATPSNVGHKSKPKVRNKSRLWLQIIEWVRSRNGATALEVCERFGIQHHANVAGMLGRLVIRKEMASTGYGKKKKFFVIGGN